MATFRIRPSATVLGSLFAVLLRTLLLTLLVGAAAHAQDATIPPLTARVTDTANLLTLEQRTALEAVLADYEAKKGTQIAVLTVSSTAPEAIEQYGIRVAEAWKIGRKGTADGVIVIVAKDNPPDLRRLRIEVGRGLEGAIPDVEAKHIIDETIAPSFRQGDYSGGLLAAVARIESLLVGEALPAPAAPAAQGVSTGVHVSGFVLFILVFFVLPFVLRTLFGTRRMDSVTGNRGSNGSLGWAVAGSILGSLANRGGGGGFGGGGGGGFSGGGGDFGGGGASGNW